MYRRDTLTRTGRDIVPKQDITCQKGIRIMKLTVNLGEHSYPIYIENHILAGAGSYISQVFKGRRIMIVSDDNVFPLYGETLLSSLSGYDCHTLVLPHGEPTKGFQSLPTIYGAMLKARISRSDLVIALGGGVIGDLPEGKNLVGAFYQPKLVLIDPTVLDTLPEHFIHDGMGEIIKYGCIKDASLFETLKSHSSFADLKPELKDVIARCVDIKRVVVEHDQFDTGERMLLNFGHTLGHTIEQYYHYERESHGEAVAIGMYQLCLAAEARGLTKKGCAARILDVLRIYGLPHACGLPIDALTEAVTLDKKNLNNKLNLVLLHDIGNSYVYPDGVEFFEGMGNV